LQSESRTVVAALMRDLGNGGCRLLSICGLHQRHLHSFRYCRFQRNWSLGYAAPIGGLPQVRALRWAGKDVRSPAFFRRPDNACARQSDGS